MDVLMVFPLYLLSQPTRRHKRGVIALADCRRVAGFDLRAAGQGRAGQRRRGEGLRGWIDPIDPRTNCGGRCRDLSAEARGTNKY